jgi:hypothetical protein
MNPMRVNLGGEGEIPGVLNQQGRWVVDPSYSSSTSQTLAQMVNAGHQFLIADNVSIPLPDSCCDEVITNNVPPPDTMTWLGPSVQTGEVHRILKSGGRWVHNGVVRFTKP